MRWLTLFLVLVIAALQYPLWLGKGSWLRVWEVDQKIAAQKKVNQGLKARNASLDAEVRDLKQGYGAIEERARSELGMIKQDEVFFQVLEGERPLPPQASGAKPESPQSAAKPPAASAKH
ncbi:MAG: cell division protein FtsB [Sulfurimicrobium sp.]|nr:cell division protein FtsB [Sulfurimicrobium sp.]MDP1705119.1 cell division protein FtsB [Sulfurimicrobium sp.]MDP2197286.1 cell division protein FtsB [Sulfurimicrobium sp.]MDP3687592.1 cell division protein FtsB [Sulfurimicrobium sp.]